MSHTDVPVAQHHRVPAGKGWVHVNEYPGTGPALVMTHGFPDDSRIYDRLLPELTGRHVVTFDFVGHGSSSRDVTGPLEPGQRERELGAVIDFLALDRPALVGHDIGGPVVIRFALERPGAVRGLILVNTFFGDSPTLEFPEFIRLLAEPHLAVLADAIFADPQVLGWMLAFTDRRLNPGPPEPQGLGATAILPQFYGDQRQPDAREAIRAWTSDLFQDLREQDAQIATGLPGQLDVPVTIAFGEHDPYFNGGVAEHLSRIFPAARRHTIADAAHWPQWDQPQVTAAVVQEALGRVSASSPASTHRKPLHP